jgi:hypothetical protein
LQLRDQQAGGPSGGARGQPSRLDDEDAAESRSTAKQRRAQPDHAAADHQHVGTAVQVVVHARVERGAVGRVRHR